MSPFVDPRSRASNAARLTPSPELMARFAPELFDDGVLGPLSPARRKRSYWQSRLGAHLAQGDARAAVVLSLQPVLVACYADDFDAAVVARFDDWVRALPGLQVGSRLLSVNLFTPRRGRRVAADLAWGPQPRNADFENFTPVVADFVSVDQQNLTTAKWTISEQEWLRCAQAGQEYLQRTGGATRDGDFRRVGRPAVPLR